MPVRVRDLEIALVLAREMKAAAARSVDASLRLEQLQEVFGVEHLDPAERARIQTALQMAGLEPHPSLLDADPTAAIRFGAAVPATTAAGSAAADVRPEPPAEPPEEPPPTFPTVGQFARSKLGRSRRFGVRRGDHGPEHVGPVDETEEPEVEVEIEAEADATQVHEHVEAPEEQPVAEAGAETEPAEEIHHEEPAHHEEPDPHEEPAHEPEYVPLAVPEEYTAPPTGYDAYASAAATEGYSPAEEPARTGARTEEVVAVLIPAVAIPVIVTSVAGWRFGLPFVALMVIASGILLGRDGGVLKAFRASPAAGVVLKATALVTVLGVGASVLLSAVGDTSSSKNTADKPVTPAKKVEKPAATAKPATPAKPEATTPSKPAPAKPKKHKPKADTGPPPDPGTAGLVRVPPGSGTQGAGPNGTQPGTGAAPAPGTQPGAGTTP